MLKHFFISLLLLARRVHKLCTAISLAERGDLDGVRALRGDAAAPGAPRQR
jgi:hypothetical protein